MNRRMPVVASLACLLLLLARPLPAAGASPEEPARGAIPRQGTDGTAAASTVSATGVFVAPELTLAARRPFGPGAGTPTPFGVPQLAEKNAGTFGVVFSVAAVLTLLVTLAAAMLLSRTEDSEGVRGRSLTLGTKLCGGFGLVITGLLVVAGKSSAVASTVANAIIESEDMSNDVLLVNEMQRDMLMVRMNVKDFLLTNDQLDLDQYSDYVASFDDKMRLARLSIQNPGRIQLMDELQRRASEYKAVFADVVPLIDERNGIVDSQLNVVAARASTLLMEITDTAVADGDPEAAAAAMHAEQLLMEAQVTFLKYMRNGRSETAAEALALAADARARTHELKSEVQNPRRLAWLEEATGAIDFWTGRVKRGVEIQAQRNALVLDRLDVMGPEIVAVGEKLVASLNDSKAEVGAEAQAAAASGRIQVAMISSAVAIGGIGLAFFIARGIIRSLTTMVARVAEIQRTNDLTTRVHVSGNDEVGRLGVAFNGMIETLERIIGEVVAGSEQIDEGGRQIAASSQAMANGATDQASNLQEIAASLQEVSSQASESAKGANEANVRSQESKAAADRGQAEMADMAVAVTEIKESSEEITAIIKVIDEIAFQTNLLALNAAVEAARAGDAGKGFAVVAEEVRSLAQRSAEAATSTASLIEKSMERSERGVRIAEGVGRALEEIAASTTASSSLLENIAAAAADQATGVSQINGGVEQLDQLTQQNAANSEELASTAEELSSQVSCLRDMVSQFKVGEVRV